MNRALILLLLALGLSATTVVYFFSPEDYTLMPPCMLHALFGLHCALCGGTRSVHALLHGDVAQAFAYNPLLVLLLPLALPLGAALGWSLWCGRAVWPRGLARWALPVCVVGIVLYTVLRNLPFAPFTAWAPHRLAH